LAKNKTGGLRGSKSSSIWIPIGNQQNLGIELVCSWGVSRFIVGGYQAPAVHKENFIACGYFEGRGGEKRQSGQGQYPYGSTGNHHWEKGDGG
jgi:hypothetical protein